MRGHDISDITLRTAFENLETYLLRWARLISGASILGVVVLLVMYHYHLIPVPTWEKAFGFLLIVMIIVAERLVVLERRISKPPLQIFRQSEDAYETLASLIRERHVKHADLIQFSGHTVVDLIKTLAKSSPGAHVRLLLQHPEVALEFDKHEDNERTNHQARIDTTLSQVGLLHEQYSKSGFRVDHQFYRTPASFSAALIDNELVVVGWYHYFSDTKTGDVRLRGHNAPAVLALGHEASSLKEFVRQQFDRLWDPSRKKV